jgi:hypothetical protein
MFPRSRIIPLHKTTRLAKRLAQPLSKHNLRRTAHALWPTFLALSLAGVAHAQGTMDFSGATTLMSTFNVSTPTVQQQVIFSNFGEVVAEQAVRSIYRQPRYIGDFLDHVERGVLFGARKVRQNVFDASLAPLVGAALMFVGRFDLAIKVAYVD